MMKNKKSQLLIFSMMFLILLLLFSYSLETRNTYKTHFSKTDILDNIMLETCQVGIRSNGSYIDERYSDFTTSVSSYCSDFGYDCSLGITKKDSAPANLSLLNYTHYDYEINYTKETLSFNGSFNC